MDEHITVMLTQRFMLITNMQVIIIDMLDEQMLKIPAQAE